ncbi:MAG TPA: hypothetical protein VME67_23875 [Mycobacterium sp.]|nr:hypothetical protein [Mycobacterium sp.]HTX97598.1 hypothetical protein [Mycobacterium sp.]
MGTSEKLTRGIAGVLISGGIAAAGLELAAGAAYADPYGHVGGNCPAGHTCGKWCPGELLPGKFVTWNMNFCHMYYYDYRGVVDPDTGTVYAWPLQNE